MRFRERRFGEVRSSLFSDRFRGLKAGASLGLLAALLIGFQAGKDRRGMSFARLGSGARWPAEGGARGRVVGPESLRVAAADPEGIDALAHGVPVRLAFRSGEPPSGNGAARGSALRPGSWITVSARHLGGAAFEVVSLSENPYRKLKLLVSGAAAIAVTALFPLFYRWSEGALRPRAG